MRSTVAQAAHRVARAWARMGTHHRTGDRGFAQVRGAVRDPALDNLMMLMATMPGAE